MKSQNKPPIKKKGSVSRKKLSPPPKVSKFWNDTEANTNTTSSIPLVYAKPIRVSNLKQARKLLSRMIYLSQIDAIDDKKAKSITYLLSVFISIVKESELEARLKALEERTGINGNRLND